jgi:hypothetical protein
MSDSKDLSASTAPTPVTQAISPGNVTQAAIVTPSGSTMSIQVPGAVDSAKIFEKFRDLLPELQTKIFGFAAGQRVIIAIEVPDLHQVAPPGVTLSDDEVEDVMVPAHFEFFGAKDPEIFKVCKQVKLDALAMGYKPMFERRFSGHFVWFNPTVDILRIYSESMRFGLRPTLTLFHGIGNPFHVFNITAISFPLTAFHREKGWLLENIKPMYSLERLELFETRLTDRAHPEFELTIHFKADFDQGIMVPHVKLANGMSLADSEVVSSIHFLTQI